jgi:hypothetical protein
MGRDLLEDLIAASPHRIERARHAACSSIETRIGLWNGTLSKLRNGRRVERSVENPLCLMTDAAELRWPVALHGRPNLEAQVRYDSNASPQY